MAAAPSLPRAVREAIGDVVYNAWTFIGANLAVAAFAFAVGYISLSLPFALVLAVLVALPVAGTMRVATRLVRDGHTDLAAFAEAFRLRGRVLGLGAAQLAVTAILGVDVLLALGWGSWTGTILLVGAVYGLAGVWTLAVVAWPIVLDPAHEGEPIRRQMQLALAVIAVRPWRVLGFAIGIGAFLALATLLVMPVVTIAIAFSCALAARFVLPLADRVTGRATPAEDDPRDP